MKLLSWLQSSAMCPVSAHSGRKEFIDVWSCEISSGGRSPLRGHGSALMRSPQDSRARPPTQAVSNQLS
jgi:hypothetical protein